MDTVFIKNFHSKRGFGNVFPFSQNLSSMEVLMMIHFILSENWWPKIKKLEYNFLSSIMKKDETLCNEGCYFSTMTGRGNRQTIKVLQKDKKFKKIC